MVESSANGDFCPSAGSMSVAGPITMATTDPTNTSLSRFLASSWIAFQPQICGIFLIGSRRFHLGLSGSMDRTPRAWMALTASAVAASVSSTGAMPPMICQPRSWM